MSDTEIALMRQRQDHFEHTLEKMDGTISELKTIQQNQHELIAAVQIKMCPAPGACIELRREIEIIHSLAKERESRIRATENLTAVLGESLRGLNIAMTDLAKSNKEHGEALARIRGQSGVIAVGASMAMTALIALVGWVVTLFKHQ